jgi:hypothetical protein
MRLFYFLLFLPFYAVSQKISTGSSIAGTFIQSLDSVQKRKTVFSFEDTSRYKWHYVPAYSVPRDGIAIRELDSLQKSKFIHCLEPV